MTVAEPARSRVARPRVVVRPRAFPPLAVRVGVSLGSILGALLVGAVLLAATGNDPWTAYRTIYTSSFGSELALSYTLVQTTPLILTALATVVLYRFNIWSIGMDGQLICGAICASGVALQFHDGSSVFVAFTAACAAGVAGGMAWALIPALLRVHLRTNEVISTLMLNFIALNLIDFLIVDNATLWRDPASAGRPQGAPLPSSLLLPRFLEGADIGVLAAVALAVGMWLLLRYTVFGYEVSILGDSPKTAVYAGINPRRLIVAAFVVSGALCGLAGSIYVTNVTLALDKASLTPGLGLGYTGIIVAMLARLQPLSCVPVAILMAALLNAGTPLELAGITPDIILVLQGLVLLLVVGGQFLTHYRVGRPAAIGGPA